MAAGRCPEALVILYARDLTLLLGQEGSRRVLLGRLGGPALRRREEAKVISHFPRVSAGASAWRSALPGACPALRPAAATLSPEPPGEPASAGTGSARRPHTSSPPPGPARLSLQLQAGGAGTGMR